MASNEYISHVCFRYQVRLESAISDTMLGWVRKPLERSSLHARKTNPPTKDTRVVPCHFQLRDNKLAEVLAEHRDLTALLLVNHIQETFLTYFCC